MASNSFADAMVVGLRKVSPSDLDSLPVWARSSTMETRSDMNCRLAASKVKAALDLFQVGKFAESRNVCAAALTLLSGIAGTTAQRCRMQLCMTYAQASYGLRNWEDTVRYSTTVLLHDPKIVGVLNMRACGYHHQGRDSDATDDLDDALKEEPWNEKVYMLRSQLHTNSALRSLPFFILQCGREEVGADSKVFEAVENYHAARQLLSGVQHPALLSHAFGPVQASLSLLRHVVGLPARRFRARCHHLLASLFFSNHDWAKCVDHSGCSLALDPEDRELQGSSRCARAKALMMQGFFEDAMQDAFHLHRENVHDKNAVELMVTIAQLDHSRRSSQFSLRTSHLLSLSTLRNLFLPWGLPGTPMLKTWQYLRNAAEIVLFGQKDLGRCSASSGGADKGCGRASIQVLSLQSGGIVSHMPTDAPSLQLPKSEACFGRFLELRPTRAMPISAEPKEHFFSKCHDGFKVVATQHECFALLPYWKLFCACGELELSLVEASEDCVLLERTGDELCFLAGKVAVSSDGWAALICCSGKHYAVEVFDTCSGDKLWRDGLYSIHSMANSGDPNGMPCEIFAVDKLLAMCTRGIFPEVSIYRCDKTDPTPFKLVSCFKLASQSPYTSPWAICSYAMALVDANQGTYTVVVNLLTRDGTIREMPSASLELCGAVLHLEFSGHHLVTVEESTVSRGGSLLRVWSVSSLLSAFCIQGSSRPCPVLQLALADQLIYSLFTWPSNARSCATSCICQIAVFKRHEPEHDDLDKFVIEPMYCGGESEEPAAQIQVWKAAQQADELWASNVQWLASKGSTDEQAEPYGNSKIGRLVLLCFGRHPKEFREALLNCNLAESLRAEGVDIQPAWAEGAIVLARNVSQSVISEIQDKVKWHVAVLEGNERTVYDTLMKLSHSVRPRLKANAGRVMVPDDISLFQDVSDDEHVDDTAETQKSQSTLLSESSWPSKVTEIAGTDLQVKRTFLHIPPCPVASPRTVQTY